MARDKKVKEDSFPFAIDRNAPRGLVDQAVDGVKAAIVGGCYSGGDLLPSQTFFAKQLGVSLKVPRRAYEKLAQDGWIVWRRGLGYAVAAPSAHVWKGRALIVCVNRGSYIGLANIGIDRKLTAAGYLVSYAYVTDDSTDPHAPLDAAMNACRYDVIYSHNASDELIARFEKAKTPYVLGIPHRRYKNGALGAFHRGSVCRDETAAIQLAQAVKEAGVRTAVWVDYQDVYSPFAAKLRRTGVATTFWRTPCTTAEITPADIRASACRAFCERLDGGKLKLPDLFLFTDDCVADGALMALALHGVKIPKDVRVVTLVNCRTGLAYPRDFTRLEVDAERDGEAIADYLLNCLGARKIRPVLKVSPRFVAGETL